MHILRLRLWANERSVNWWLGFIVVIEYWVKIMLSQIKQFKKKGYIDFILWSYIMDSLAFGDVPLNSFGFPSFDFPPFSYRFRPKWPTGLSSNLVRCVYTCSKSVKTDNLLVVLSWNWNFWFAITNQTMSRVDLALAFIMIMRSLKFDHYTFSQYLSIPVVW